MAFCSKFWCGRAFNREGEGKKRATWRVFSLKELHSATNNFNYDNKLGEGGFGSVYWGQLWDGSQFDETKSELGFCGVRVTDIIVLLMGTSNATRCIRSAKINSKLWGISEAHVHTYDIWEKRIWEGPRDQKKNEFLSRFALSFYLA